MRENVRRQTKLRPFLPPYGFWMALALGQDGILMLKFLSPENTKGRRLHKLQRNLHLLRLFVQSDIKGVPQLPFQPICQLLGGRTDSEGPLDLGCEK